VLIYADARGSRPFERWLSGIRDNAARGLIRARIARMEAGNFGDCAPIGGGVSELRIHHGPGYRVYFGINAEGQVLLLCGGTKRTQGRDLVKARRFWIEAREAP
jgi:putative addiction module killer protein